MPWSDSPDTNAFPARRTGTWRTNPIGDILRHIGKWQTSLEKVSAFTGGGGLSAIINPNRDIHVQFGGSGSFSPAYSQIVQRLVQFSGVGLPTGFGNELYNRTVQLSGGGGFSALAVEQLPVPVAVGFSGDGALSDYLPKPDGLSASITFDHDGLHAVVSIV